VGLVSGPSRLSERFTVGVDSALRALHSVDMGSVADVSEIPSASFTHFYPEDADTIKPSKVSIARMHGSPAVCFLSLSAFHWLFVAQFCF
jgi:hypothetical protein